MTQTSTLQTQCYMPCLSAGLDFNWSLMAADAQTWQMIVSHWDCSVSDYKQSWYYKNKVTSDLTDGWLSGHNAVAKIKKMLVLVDTVIFFQTTFSLVSWWWTQGLVLWMSPILQPILPQKRKLRSCAVQACTHLKKEITASKPIKVNK